MQPETEAYANIRDEVRQLTNNIQRHANSSAEAKKIAKEELSDAKKLKTKLFRKRQFQLYVESSRFEHSQLFAEIRRFRESAAKIDEQLRIINNHRHLVEYCFLEHIPSKKLVPEKEEMPEEANLIYNNLHNDPRSIAVARAHIRRELRFDRQTTRLVQASRTRLPPAAAAAAASISQAQLTAPVSPAHPDAAVPNPTAADVPMTEATQ